MSSVSCHKGLCYMNIVESNIVLSVLRRRLALHVFGLLFIRNQDGLH